MYACVCSLTDIFHTGQRPVRHEVTPGLPEASSSSGAQTHRGVEGAGFVTVWYKFKEEYSVRLSISYLGCGTSGTDTGMDGEAALSMGRPPSGVLVSVCWFLISEGAKSGVLLASRLCTSSSASDVLGQVVQVTLQSD